MHRPGLGEHVYRVPTAIPSNTNEALFTIAGGAILVTYLIGRVTTILAGAGVSLSVQHNDGVAADLLCTATVVTTDPEGTLYHFSADPATALVNLEPGTALAGHGGFLGGDPTGQGVLGRGSLCPAGDIEALTNAACTGQLSWNLYYIPLHAGVTVVAVYP